MQRKREFQSPFSALFSSTTPTFYFHCGMLFPWQIVLRFASALSIGFLSFLSCSHWQCIFPSWFQLLQSWLGPPYSVLHALLDCISPPRHCPRHLPALFLSHFVVCRVCLQMTLCGVPHDDEFSSLPIHLLKFFLCSLYYSSSILDCWNNLDIDSLEYISCI